MTPGQLVSKRIDQRRMSLRAGDGAPDEAVAGLGLAASAAAAMNPRGCLSHLAPGPGEGWQSQERARAGDTAGCEGGLRTHAQRHAAPSASMRTASLAIAIGGSVTGP